MKKIVSILFVALFTTLVFAVSYKNNTYQKLADEYTKKAEMALDAGEYDLAIEYSQKAAENAEIPVNFSTIPLGSTDAAAMQQGGIKSVAFTSMDPAPARYYHTRDDNVSVLEMKTLEDSLKVVLETIYLFDEQGLKDSY